MLESWTNNNILEIYLSITLIYYIDIEKSYKKKKFLSLVFDISDKRMR